MNIRFALLICFFLPGYLFSQPLIPRKDSTGYWQQEMKYNIAVSLNDQAHTISGKLTLDYLNNSPDTLTYIWFHIWPNAYKNDSTALARQLAADKESEKKNTIKEAGFISNLNFVVNNRSAAMEPDSANIDIVKVVLPQPLLPGKTAKIITPFLVKLPSYYSRSGHDGQNYMVCQWYPKPAVYDRKGWHAFPYLDQGEFYSEYGTYAVSITLPSEYVIAATGVLQTPVELAKYKTIGLGNRAEGKSEKYKSDFPGGLKTLQFNGEKIHDFAWFASKDFIIRYDTLQLSSGVPVNVFSYSQPNGNKQWINSTDYIKDAVKHYSKWIGEYPYPTVQAVEGPKNQSSGGMEYPMVTLITSPDADEAQLDGVITHEVGHNWFYGILGSNERDNPWMDEGINTYFQFRYEAEKYRANSVFGASMPKELKKLPMEEFQSRVYNALNSIPANGKINTGSTGFANKEDYGIVVYLKTAVWMYLIETAIGRETMDKALHEYFSTWKFRHPYPEDLKEVMEKAAGKKLDNLFDLLNKEGNF